MTSLIHFSPPPVSQGDVGDCGVCSVIDALQTIGALTGDPVSYDPNAVYVEYQQVYGTTAAAGANPIGVALMLAPQAQINGLFIGMTLNAPQLAGEINASLAAGQTAPPAVTAPASMSNTTVATAATTAAPTAAATAASAAPATAAPVEKLLACVDIGNFDPNEARSFRARLAAAKLRSVASQRSVQEVASYMVYIAAENGREGADRRAAELRRLGLSDFYIMPESSPMRDTISLGLFKTEAAAKAYIGQLISKGVRSARIVERTASTNKVAFRLRNLNAADQAGFAGLAAAFPNQARRDCSG